MNILIKDYLRLSLITVLQNRVKTSYLELFSDNDSYKRNLSKISNLDNYFDSIVFQLPTFHCIDGTSFSLQITPMYGNFITENGFCKFGYHFLEVDVDYDYDAFPELKEHIKSNKLIDIDILQVLVDTIKGGIDWEKTCSYENLKKLL